jgi:hypothetical protein
MRFAAIETYATVRGQKVTSTFSYANPVNYEEYRRIVEAHFKAYPSPESRPSVIGRPVDPPLP